MAGSVSGRGPGQPEEPGAGRLGTRRIVGCKPKIGERLMENELLYAKVDQLEVGGPLARRRSRR